MATTPTGAPTAADVLAYLDYMDGEDYPGEVNDALAAEAADQLNRCRFPLGDDGNPAYTPALTEALYRRVAHNLAVRAIPLGVQTTSTEAAALNTYIPGSDAEVRRLEAPYRKRTVG